VLSDTKIAPDAGHGRMPLRLVYESKADAELPQGISLAWNNQILVSIAPNSGTYDTVKAKFDSIVASDAAIQATKIKRLKQQALLELRTLK